MAKTTVERRFLFHANSVALGAHIRRPEESFISAVASSCLPITGGIARAESDGRTFRNILSYAAASSSAFGDYQNPKEAVKFTRGNHGDNLLPTVTLAEAQITGLRILNGGRLFHAGELAARIDSTSDRRSAPNFHSLSATFNNLSIDGMSLKINTDCGVFGKYGTLASLREAHKDKDFRTRYADQFSIPEPRRKHWFSHPSPELPEPDQPIFATVVSRLSWRGNAPKGCAIERNRVIIDNFGSIYLGEMLVQEGARRLTMLRFQLGSPEGGEGAAVDVSCNGTGWPPRVDPGT